MFITAKIFFVFICTLIVEQKERSTYNRLGLPRYYTQRVLSTVPMWPCIRVLLCNLCICYFHFLGTSNQRRPLLVPGVAPEWLLYQITFVSVIFLKRNIYSQGSQGCHHNILHHSLVSIIFMQGNHQKGDTFPGVKDVPWKSVPLYNLCNNCLHLKTSPFWGNHWKMIQISFIHNCDYFTRLNSNESSS